MHPTERRLPNPVRIATLIVLLALAAQARAADPAKVVVIDGKPFVANGKTVESDGKYILVDGKPVTVDGQPLRIDGKTVVIDGKTVSKFNPTNKAAAGAAPLLVFTIDLRWLGATRYRIERDITMPVERAVKTLPGVVAVSSSTLSGRAQTRVSFDSKTDASTTANALRNRLDQIKRNLPHDASQPLIAWSREPTP